MGVRIPLLPQRSSHIRHDRIERVEKLIRNGTRSFLSLRTDGSDNLLEGRIHHGSRSLQKFNLVFGLYHSCIKDGLLAIRNIESSFSRASRENIGMSIRRVFFHTAFFQPSKNILCTLSVLRLRRDSPLMELLQGKLGLQSRTGNLFGGVAGSRAMAPVSRQNAISVHLLRAHSRWSSRNIPDVIKVIADQDPRSLAFKASLALARRSLLNRSKLTLSSKSTPSFRIASFFSSIDQICFKQSSLGSLLGKMNRHLLPIQAASITVSERVG